MQGRRCQQPLLPGEPPEYNPSDPMKSLKNRIVPVALLALMLVVAITWPDSPAPVRGKSPARALDLPPSETDRLAQDLALSDSLVIDLTTGKRSEVFAVNPVIGCGGSECRQVTIYNFDDNTAVIALIDVASAKVVEVQYQPGMLPAANNRLTEVAARVIHDSEQVAAELGFHPPIDSVELMPSSLAGTPCGSIHPCLGAVFPAGERFLWAHVDLTTEKLAGIAWSPALAEEGEAAVYVPQACPQPGSIIRDGWQFDYSVSGSDGLQVRNVRYKLTPVMASAKLAEWHVDYGNTGFNDATGCGSGQSYIAPYGGTQVLELLDAGGQSIGFEIVQDFRMASWGQFCNYRYGQRYQFFADGRFRVVAGAYGRGCGTNAEYRPVVRIDLDIGGPESDRFAAWDETAWIRASKEISLTQQAAAFTQENQAWLVEDAGRSFGYYIEPGAGQFSDGGRGDNAFVYVAKHSSSEGDADMLSLGTCCNNDYQQGPEKFVNGESINGENLVLWYVPQFLTDAAAGSEYCWTVTGGSEPETYPCFGGPLFHPFNWPEPFELWLPILRKGP